MPGRPSGANCPRTYCTLSIYPPGQTSAAEKLLIKPLSIPFPATNF